MKRFKMKLIFWTEVGKCKVQPQVSPDFNYQPQVLFGSRIITMPLSYVYYICMLCLVPWWIIQIELGFIEMFVIRILIAAADVVKIEWQCLSINAGLHAKSEDPVCLGVVFPLRKRRQILKPIAKKQQTLQTHVFPHFSVWNIAFENLSVQTLNFLVFWYWWLVLLTLIS